MARTEEIRMNHLIVQMVVKIVTLVPLFLRKDVMAETGIYLSQAHECMGGGWLTRVREKAA
jgi:hypothetical protein